MDASKLKVGDAFDRVCTDPFCRTGTHREVMVSREGDRATVIRDGRPYPAIQVEFKGSEMWAVNGPHLEIADVYEGEGVEAVKRYDLYEALVTECQKFQLDDFGFELEVNSLTSEIDMVLAVVSDARIDRLSGAAYGILKLAGYEPTPKAMVLLVQLMKLYSSKGQATLTADLLGGLVGLLSTEES